MDYLDIFGCLFFTFRYTFDIYGRRKGTTTYALYSS